MEEAIVAYRNEDYTSARSAALAFGLEPQRLQRRLKGLPSKSTRPQTNMVLTDAQELAVLQYIERLDHIHMSPKLSMLYNAANYLLAKACVNSNTPPQTVGEKWVFCFLARHPNLFLQKCKPLAVECSHAEDPVVLAVHFEEF